MKKLPKNSPDIEHATAEEILAVVRSQLFTAHDAKVCADALLVVAKAKQKLDEAKRKKYKNTANFLEDLLNV